MLTIGYEGRTVEEVIDLLRANAATVLVDVRLTPLSRKPGLSKTRLAGTLAAAGIGYLHLPALGNPKENRPAFRAGLGRDVLLARLRSAEGVAAVARVRALDAAERPALFCFERDPAGCHRLVVATEAGGTVTHL
jgi:hypothetical protein